MAAGREFGIHVFGLGGVLLGAVGLAWGNFVDPWQPVPETVPGRSILAYLAGLVLLAGGIAVQARKTIKPGALALALIALLFTLAWLAKTAAAPREFINWLGVAEQAAIVIGGLCCYLLVLPRDEARAGRTALVLRLAFGVCVLVFAGAHFIYPDGTAAFVPAWIPPGQTFWAYATGVGHLLAGLALLSGIAALLAARLLTAMFVGFGLLVWAPMLAGAPNVHMNWGGNGMNLALIGAAWVVADMVARFGASRPGKSAADEGAAGAAEAVA